MSADAFPYDCTIRELMQHIPKGFTEILLGLNVVEVIDPSFPLWHRNWDTNYTKLRIIRIEGKFCNSYIRGICVLKG